MKTISFFKAKALLNSAFLGDFRAIATLLRGLTYGYVLSPRLVEIPDAATYTVLASDTGKTHVLPNLTADITISLPTPSEGLEYTFIYGGAAADAQDWIITAGTGNAVFFMGGVVHLDTDAVAAGIEVVAVFSDGNSNEVLTVLTPTAGTRVNLISDGSVWYVDGRVASATAPTFTD